MVRGVARSAGSPECPTDEEKEMKKTTKKLSLNRETIRALVEDQLREAAGGLEKTDTDTCHTRTCPSYCNPNC